MLDHDLKVFLVGVGQVVVDKDACLRPAVNVNDGIGQLCDRSFEVVGVRDVGVVDRRHVELVGCRGEYGEV